MADEDSVVLAEVIEQSDEVVGELGDAVRLDLAWCRRVAVAALVGGDDMVAGLGERRHLVTPRVGELGEAVAQHDRRVGRIAGLVHVAA